MLRESFREGPERIRVIGGGVGADGVAAHVRFSTDHEGRCFSWATATGVGCAGDVRLHETADGAAVELDLRLGGRAERPGALAHWTGDAALNVAEAMQASLAAVKELCEGATEGVSLVSGGAQSDPSTAPLRDSREFGETATQIPSSPEEVRRRD
jgi:hypothetical protein